jgi:hypothetical protein
MFNLNFHTSINEAALHATPWAAIGGILMGFAAMLPSPANYVVGGIATAMMIMGCIIKSPNDGKPERVQDGNSGISAE